MSRTVRKRPPDGDSLYCGVFRKADYLGSMYLTEYMRAVMRKNGYALVLWSI